MYSGIDKLFFCTVFLTFKYLYFSFILKRVFCFIATFMRIMLMPFK